ncbi:MAG: translation initiation factor IF-2 subunit gamma [Candidatus Woesearchaeota archaeon]
MQKKANSVSSEDVEKGQPVLNIGLIGHVDHGKTTLTEAMSGRWTDTHSEEMRRGITIKLGYANTIIRKFPDISDHTAYTVNDEKIGDKSPVPIKKISFVDAPGHESLMATMLSGATIMDGAILMISATEECPQPQTREHLMALEIMDVDKIIVVQNKIDLVSPEEAKENYNSIKEFLSTTKYKDAPIVPVSAQHRVNIDLLLETIDKTFEVPERDRTLEPIMFVARSFDINRPGLSPSEINGGVLGGSLKQGVFKVDDEIEIKPGRRIEENNQIVYYPIKTKIKELYSGSEKIEEAFPGGSIGVSTFLDPGVVKSDSLIGSLVGHHGKLPETLHELSLEIHLLDRVVGSKSDIEVEKIKPGETLMLNVNASSTVGQVTKSDGKKAHFKLKLPVCAEPGARVTISRMIGSRFRLIGYGVII